MKQATLNARIDSFLARKGAEFPELELLSGRTIRTTKY
jgi:hypothetical protein